MEQVHVVPRSDGWAVIKAGADRATALADTKQQAVDLARDISRNSGAEMFVHNRDGQFGYRNSYGHDSYPPEG